MVKRRGESKSAWKKGKQKITLIWMNWALLQASCAYRTPEWLKAVGSLDSVDRGFRLKAIGFLYLIPKNFSLNQ